MIIAVHEVSFRVSPKEHNERRVRGYRFRPFPFCVCSPLSPATPSTTCRLPDSHHCSFSPGFSLTPLRLVVNLLIHSPSPSRNPVRSRLPRVRLSSPTGFGLPRRPRNPIVSGCGFGSSSRLIAAANTRLATAPGLQGDAAHRSRGALVLLAGLALDDEGFGSG